MLLKLFQFCIATFVFSLLLIEVCLGSPLGEDYSYEALDSSEELPTHVDESSSLKVLPIPPVWKETWHHTENLSLIYVDPHVAIYVDNQNNNSKWFFRLLSKAWKYVKETYGSYGPDQHLYVIIHSVKHSGCIEGSYRIGRYSHHNAIDCGPVSGKSWAHRNDLLIKMLAKSIGRLVLSWNTVLKGADSKICGNGISEIIGYDLYHHLVQGIEKNETEANVENSTQLHKVDVWEIEKVNSYNQHYCFSDFYLPVYEKYGGVLILRSYLNFINLYWPIMRNRNMNSGEFLHFWSGAAGADLRDFGYSMFKWDGDNLDVLLTKARKDFPFFTYSITTLSTTGGQSLKYVPPRTWQKTWSWSGINDSLQLAYADEHVAFYFQNLQFYANQSSSYIMISKSWQYLKEKYVPSGKDSYVYVVLSKISSNNQSNYECRSSNDIFLKSAQFQSRHVIDCGLRVHNKWIDKGIQIPGAFDEVFTELAIMAMALNVGNGTWPPGSVSHWSISSIIVYDVYVGLNLCSDEKRWREKEMKDRPELLLHPDDKHYMSENEPWFRDWYFKIYMGSSGSTSINNFLSLLHAYWPKGRNATDFTGEMNLGEFVHFWSGATKEDLSKLAAKSLRAWDQESLNQFNEAKKKFSGFHYTCLDCDGDSENVFLSASVHPGKSAGIRNGKARDSFSIVTGVLILLIIILSLTLGLTIGIYSKKIKKLNQQILNAGNDELLCDNSEVQDDFFEGDDQGYSIHTSLV